MSDAGNVPSAICFGIALTTEPAATRARLDELCAALSSVLGLHVVGRGLWHYHRLLESMDAGEVDVGWLPPILALRAAARKRVVPIALPVRGGVASYSTALFTRPGSGITDVRDLAGVRAAWVDRQSAAGYLIIRAHLRALGVDLEHAFAADQFLGAHDAVARAVLDGEADVGATFVHIGAGAPGAPAVTRAGWGSAPVRILAHAGPIPSDIIAATTRTPVPVMRALQTCLVAATDQPLRRAAMALLGADEFVVPLREHLEPLTQLLAGMEDGPPGRTPTMPPTG